MQLIAAQLWEFILSTIKLNTGKGHVKELGQDSCQSIK